MTKVLETLWTDSIDIVVYPNNIHVETEQTWLIADDVTLNIHDNRCNMDMRNKGTFIGTVRRIPIEDAKKVEKLLKKYAFPITVETYDDE